MGEDPLSYRKQRTELRTRSFLKVSTSSLSTVTAIDNVGPYVSLTKTTIHNFCLQLQMLLFPNALCCLLYEHNCVCAVTKIFTKFLPANNFCQLLRVTRKRSCTFAGNAQAQLHFRDDQQRAFGISNISNSWGRGVLTLTWYTYTFEVFFMKFGIAIRGFSSETKEPKLHKLGVFWANYCEMHSIWSKLGALLSKMVY